MKTRPLPERLRYLSAKLDRPVAVCTDQQAVVTMVAVKVILEMTADELDSGSWVFTGVGDGSGGAGGETAAAGDPPGDVHPA